MYNTVSSESESKMLLTDIEAKEFALNTALNRFERSSSSDITDLLLVQRELTLCLAFVPGKNKLAKRIAVLFIIFMDSRRWFYSP